MLMVNALNGFDAQRRIPHPWNPDDKYATISLSGDDLVAASTEASWRSVRAKNGIKAGKAYWEVVLTTLSTASSTIPGFGDETMALSNYVGASGLSAGMQAGFAINHTAFYEGITAHASDTISHAAGNVIMFALDMDLGRAWAGKNGTWYNSGDPGAGTNYCWSGLTGGHFHPAVGMNGTSGQVATLRTRRSEFSHAVPNGFAPFGEF
jgi:hypothetical protein